MSIAKTYSALICGLKAEKISVEIDISNGLHSFSIVGLGDRAVDEAKDRISAGIKNSGYTSPKQKNQKVVISLAPADMRKEGPIFDLAMAVGYLLASNEILFESETKLFLGELSLDGDIRAVSGILPILCQAKNMGFTEVYIPFENIEEATLVNEVSIIPVKTLNETLEYLSGNKNLFTDGNIYIKNTDDIEKETCVDMNNVRGNIQAKRGLEIAAAGGHNIVMYGPPGTGKTMLAKSFPSILPDLSHEESIEVTSIHSIAKTIERGLIKKPPFRAPHHTASYPAIVGGGNIPKPGEITLAHRGVLFMDEFPEFDRSVIEALRQPLEEREITIARAKGTVTFPANCILIASMNPCPCGRGEKNCICSQKTITKYKEKISGPIADRVDIWINVHKVEYNKLGMDKSQEESSAEIRKRVEMARGIQANRFDSNNTKKKLNCELDSKDLEKYIKINDEVRKSLIAYAEKLELSGRSFHRVIKVARTIADLEQKKDIEESHILEALSYRQKI